MSRRAFPRVTLEAVQLSLGVMLEAVPQQAEESGVVGTPRRVAWPLPHHGGVKIAHHGQYVPQPV
ncbi:MAG: hypothetical protein N3E40_03055 [Dehalococcoidia bacterium]|nr:hypothetical protein [Dehalococcoidia bacterium]